MANSLFPSTPAAVFLAVFSVLERPGVVVFDSTADAIGFLESSAELDELAPLGVVEWDDAQQCAQGVHWQYSLSIPAAIIIASALEGFADAQH